MPKKNLILIAGPCVIESKQLTYDIAAQLKAITSRHPIDLYFKASFDKANRTSLKSYRGPGLDQGLKILSHIKKTLKIPVVSDVHYPHQIKDVKNTLDIIQIPAFLSRQTDLLLEAGKTQKTINIKKAQFMAPHDIIYAIKKVESTGNKKILITERGTCFGYNNLVVDFRSFSIMKQYGYPIIYDATHSLQKPSSAAGISGGDRAFIPSMALAATAAGINGIFMEVHPNPAKALCDKNTTFALNKLDALLDKICRVREIV